MDLLSFTSSIRALGLKEGDVVEDVQMGVWPFPRIGSDLTRWGETYHELWNRNKRRFPACPGLASLRLDWRIGAALCCRHSAHPDTTIGGRGVRIANPIYDPVFKHLLEDPESTRLIVGTILDEEINDIDLAPQERSVRVEPPKDDARLTDFSWQRIAFAATVRTAAGERLRVLIEVQKSHYSEDVLRFRRYLGQRYAAESSSYVTVREGGGERRQALPLLTIYFLGRRLPKTEATVLKVARRYVDAVTGEELPLREDFVEALTHDCYVVQVPRLSDERRNDLEKLLSIFDQRLRTEDQHILELDHAAIPLAYAPVLRRLQAAAADESVAASMELEDDVIGEWTRMQRDIAGLDETIAKLDETIAGQAETLAGQEETIADRDETIRRQQAEIEALRRRMAGAD